MERKAIDKHMALGKEAARRGENALALDHLRAVVEADPENENAWLWLSAVVDGDEDRRLCLENVLVLNPDSQAARRGLALLDAAGAGADRAGAGAAGVGTLPGQVVEIQSAPLTLAQAILYPERVNKNWRWHDPIELHQTAVAGFSAESSFDDVWQSDTELCAYCATELRPEDRRCPGCGRQLVASAFRYPRASNDLTIYWVLMLGIAQLALVTILFNLLSQGSPASLAWQTTVFLGMVIIVAGLAFRRFWAYAASILAALLLLTAMILGPSLGPVVDNSLSQLAGRDFFLRVGQSPSALFAGPAADLLRLLQFAAVILALVYALLRVGPDFERVKKRQVAELDRGISDASHFHGAGVAYGRQGMWATAVLHFQRAAALEPANPFYQRDLADAYARLGHYQRCLDVLESSLKLTRDPETRAATEHRIAEIREQQRAQGR